MGIFRKALNNRNGSVAVEFAFVAPIFFALMFSLFEVGWFYFVNAQVDATVQRAARMIRTGQAQQQALDRNDFFNEVCPDLTIFGGCNDKLTIEVETFNSFAALAADNSPVICRDDNPEEINAIAYDPGADGDIVRVRICLIYQTINPALGLNVSDTANGTRRLHGSFLFRNEPFARRGSVQ